MTPAQRWWLTRRSFVARGVPGAIGLASGCATDPFSFPLPPVRSITRGPRFHWFGYYDKLEFDPTNRYVLGNEVEFEGRKPEPEDILRVGMIDTEENDRWIELGQSTAWSWQQGCMLQWIPPTSTQVIWNDREDGAYVSRILDVTDAAARVRTLPRPIFCLSRDGKTAFTIDFARINGLRPGYGYPGIPDVNVDELAPEDEGIWRMDLETGASELIFSIADAARIPGVDGDWEPDAKHWLYHLLVNTDDTRLSFLHCNSGASLTCRMITIDLDGGSPYVLDPYGQTSHYDWRDPTHVLAWSFQPNKGYGFFLFTDRTAEVVQIGRGTMNENGHCTYLVDHRWILNDTYPNSHDLQNPFLFDTETGHRYWLGHFESPEPYRGEFRCDTHPRSSRDGRTVIVDSPHEGGRQMYLIETSEILDSVE